MNVLGHAHVARRVRPGDDAYVLGAVLPDLASMAGVRLATGTATASPAIISGIALHHAADAAFHSLARFRAGVAAMRRELLAAGLGTGPARAVAHAGYELVLDGALVGTATEHAYRRALTLVTGANAVIVPGHRGRWDAFVQRVLTEAHRPIGYDDVDWVANRLVAILDHRPRLRLDLADVSTVARVLGRHAVAIRDDAPAVLEATFGAGLVG